MAGYEGARAQPQAPPSSAPLDYDVQHLQLLLTANTQDMLQHTVLEEDCKLGARMGARGIYIYMYRNKRGLQCGLGPLHTHPNECTFVQPLFVCSGEKDKDETRRRSCSLGFSSPFVLLYLLRTLVLLVAPHTPNSAASNGAAPAGARRRQRSSDSGDAAGQHVPGAVNHNGNRARGWCYILRG